MKEFYSLKRKSKRTAQQIKTKNAIIDVTKQKFVDKKEVEVLFIAVAGKYTSNFKTNR